MDVLIGSLEWRPGSECGAERPDPIFAFVSSQVVWSALMDYQDSKPVRGKTLDFADTLITHKAHYIANIAGLELDGFYSFDKALEQLKGAKTPK